MDISISTKNKGRGCPRLKVGGVDVGGEHAIVVDNDLRLETER